jgi:hypothetical protein
MIAVQKQRDSTRNWVLTLVLILVSAALLAGCGKRARSLDPPEGTQGVFPKHYPPPDAPGERL